MADLTKSTIPIAWTFGMATTVVACTVWVVRTLLEGNHAQTLAAAEFKAEIRTELQGIRFELKEANEDRWRREDMLRFAEGLRKLNPTMLVPEVPR
jgi:hypothetical protein